jgi:hypothetical protein
MLTRSARDAPRDVITIPSKLPGGYDKISVTLRPFSSPNPPSFPEDASGKAQGARFSAAIKIPTPPVERNDSTKSPLEKRSSGNLAPEKPAAHGHDGMTGFGILPCYGITRASVSAAVGYLGPAWADVTGFPYSRAALGAYGGGNTGVTIGNGMEARLRDDHKGYSLAEGGHSARRYWGVTCRMPWNPRRRPSFPRR